MQRRARIKRELQGKARAKVRRLECPFTVLSVRYELAGEAMVAAALALGGALIRQNRGGEERGCCDG
ncbi:hypothetical protein GGD87_001118 [Rhodobaca bogoriensis DSM 18756]|nr:hypothetical protein [Rhodobaca bogoriensis DSM 18756]